MDSHNESQMADTMDHLNAESKRAPLAVIVAEKDPIVRAALAALLSHDGYRVFQAESLQAAIARINSMDDLAVLLADLDMPGWRTVVRQAVKTGRALVIAMEGDHPVSDAGDLTERGIRVRLKKPIVYAEVQQAIRKNPGARGSAGLTPEEGELDERSRVARKTALT
jgi:CheY-like chemotaxis protein